MGGGVTWRETITAEAERTVYIAKCRCFAGCRDTVGWNAAAAALTRQQPACPTDSGDAARGGVAAVVLTRLPPTCLAGYKDAKRGSIVIRK